MRISNNMSEKTEKELIEVIEFLSSEYQSWAVEAAKKELDKRSLSELQYQDIRSSIAFQRDTEAKLKSQEANAFLRALNFLLDSICLAGIAYGLHYWMNGATVYSIPLIVFMFIAYYMSMEFYYGKTIGKIITNTKVVSRKGYELDLYQVYIRTMCRFIPIDFASYLFPYEGMKWHDLFSGTRVIKDGK